MSVSMRSKFSKIILSGFCTHHKLLPISHYLNAVDTIEVMATVAQGMATEVATTLDGEGQDLEGEEVVLEEVEEDSPAVQEQHQVR